VALLLNVLWLIFGGGLILGLSWLVMALLFAVSIVGLPWARAALNMSFLAFAPFGRVPISRLVLNEGRSDLGTGPVGMIGNIVWFVLAGFWLALAHVAVGVANCITIIGIPFGLANFRMASAALFPVGMAIVPKAVAEEATRRAAIRSLDGLA
jgi:uncharacterized membrane protein YccF (DUF307 family)